MRFIKIKTDDGSNMLINVDKIESIIEGPDGKAEILYADDATTTSTDYKDLIRFLNQFILN